jgi:nitrous oxidase accessory protein
MLRAVSMLAILLPLGQTSGADLDVGAGKTHATITAAIAAAASGDTIRVHAGTYREGKLDIDKPLTLEGVGNPVLDGVKKHEVLTITASDVTVRGFTVRDSASGGIDDPAGIRVNDAERVTIEGNTLVDCYFAIYLGKAKHCTVRDNTITGDLRGEHDTGNGIHLWSCEHITATDNTIRRHRDGIYLEFANDSVIERNQVDDCLRYGLHYMFSHRSVYRHNTFSNSGAGVAVMYSRNVDMSHNRFVKNWGASSYGLLLKDMTDGTINGNDFDSNTTAIAMHGSNRMTVERNRFANNGRAIQVQGSSTDNTYRNNNFTGNSFDVAAEGELTNNRFENNYWQKYEGYDLKRDGTGDVPYRPVSLYSVVVGRVPSAMLLMRSPIVHLLDQAEKAFPTITPERVTDDKPAMKPHPFSLTKPDPHP